VQLYLGVEDYHVHEKKKNPLKNHKLLLVTELIFCNDPKANGKKHSGFSRGNQGDGNFLGWR